MGDAKKKESMRKRIVARLETLKDRVMRLVYYQDHEDLQHLTDRVRLSSRMVAIEAIRQAKLEPHVVTSYDYTAFDDPAKAARLCGPGNVKVTEEMSTQENIRTITVQVVIKIQEV